MTYTGVPNKKRKVYASPDGSQFPLGFKLGDEDRMLIVSSGTLDSSGLLSVTGTEFKTTSMIQATYNDSSAGTAPIAVMANDGSADFRGDASTDFYYAVFNMVLGG